MKQATRPRASAERIEDRIAELERNVQDLKDLLNEALDASTGDEVRCRRLVVVDEHGRERVTIGARDEWAGVTVSSADDRNVYVSLYASEEDGPEDATAGVYLAGGGDGAGTFCVRRSGERYAGEVAVDVPNSEGHGAMVLDETGVHMSDMRLYSERESWRLRYHRPTR